MRRKYIIGLAVGFCYLLVTYSKDNPKQEEPMNTLPTKTSFIEARLIVGDEKLFARFQKTVLAKCVSGHEEQYIAARMKDQSERRAKYGNSAEPRWLPSCG